MSPVQSWARTIVAVSRVTRHPSAPAELGPLVERTAELVRLWAEDQHHRISAWAARGASSGSPLETFEQWRERRSL